MGSTATTRLHSRPLPFALETGSMFVIAEQRDTPDGERAGTSQMCVERRDGGCEPVAPRGGSDQLSAGSSGVTRVVDTQAYRPGVWEAEWVSAGQQQLRLFALAVGPGPRPTAQLPDPATTIGVANPAGGSRNRTVLDACPSGDVPAAGYTDVAPGAQAEAVDCLTRPVRVFADVAGNTREGSISSLADNGIVRGVDGERYGPDGEVSRAQMAFFLTRTLDLLVEIGRARTP